MQNIIKTRRTVKYYIWFTLSMVPVISIVTLYQTFNSQDFVNKISEDTNMTVIWLISIVLILVMILLIWLFYRLLYGILLNKLKTNYEELVSNED